MSVPADSGYQRKAAFSLRGTDSELDKSAPLVAGESIVIHGGLRAREGGVIRSPAVIRLTNLRLSVVRHFAFHSDLICEIPPEAVLSIDYTGRNLAIQYRDRTRGDVVLQLSPWTGRNPLARALRDLSALRDALGAWCGR
ncbi:MAG: hypothetical protein ABIP57_07660 [Jatrophihabitantaceae bacterium]